MARHARCVYDGHMANTKKALVSGRILKRSGLVIMRSGVATVTRSSGGQWEETVPKALDSAAHALIEFSAAVDVNGTTLTYTADGRLA